MIQPPKLTAKEQKAVDDWKKKVYEANEDNDTLEDCDWGDMATGWLMAHGCTPERAVEISAFMRYGLGIA